MSKCRLLYENEIVERGDFCRVIGQSDDGWGLITNERVFGKGPNDLVISYPRYEFGTARSYFGFRDLGKLLPDRFTNTPVRSNMTMAFTTLFRCKWLGDGSKSLGEMAGKLEAAARQLREMAEAGIILDGEVQDDFAELTTDDPVAAAKYGLHDLQEDDEEDEEQEADAPRAYEDEEFQ